MTLSQQWCKDVGWDTFILKQRWCKNINGNMYTVPDQAFEDKVCVTSVIQDDKLLEGLRDLFWGTI